MKFILPRLFGLALIAGIGAIILSFVFKALVGIAIIASIATLVWRGMSRRRKFGPGQYGMQNAWRDQMDPGQHNSFAKVAVPTYEPQRASGIIPIN